MRHPATAGERGQVVVFFALLLPVLFALSAFVIGIGNWYVHGKNLQTKADAGAFAGGGVWGFPCAGDIDSRIETQARLYAGSNNPQVGKVPNSSIHTVLNGSDWYDDDSNPFPVERNDPSNPSICDAKILDVKVTEDNSFPLASIIPLFPDIKRKARVEIDQVEGVSGVLPISVRVPKPVSAAAVFYNEANGNILAAKNFCESSGIIGLPAGLGGWTTFDPANPSGLCSSWANFSVAGMTGVAIATSFRPACGTGSPPLTTNCFSTTGFSQVDDLCRQGAGKYVQCFWANGSGNSQTMQSGLQFIRGYPTGTVTTGPPALRTAWLDQGNCASAYFNSVTGSCTAILRATVDVGSVITPPPPPGGTETRKAANTEVRYRVVYRNPGNGNLATFCAFNTPTCDLNGSGSGGNTSWSTTNQLPLFNQQTAGNAIAMRVRLRNTTVGATNCGNNFSATCEWFFTGNGISTTAPTDAQVFAAPVQRSFMGDDDLSGPIKFVRLTTSANCDGTLSAEGASQTQGPPHCFYVEMGLKGVIAKDQDEPPIVFNLKGSQSAALDCDPNISNLKDEVVAGCSPFYAVNQFNTNPDCPAANQFFTVPKAPPFDNWPPYRCVLTQTGNPTQLLSGFSERFFGPNSNPPCPADNASAWVKGRNYWHDANNLYDNYTFAQDNPAPPRGNRLKNTDPRLVQLFMTAYDSFTNSGNEVFPIINFGSFYVTGYGRGKPGGGLIIDDPCSDGSSDPSPGAGNKAPPDIVTQSGGAYVWGHFVNTVTPSPNSTPSGNLCQPAVSFMPCVAVLVQ